MRAAALVKAEMGAELRHQQLLVVAALAGSHQSACSPRNAILHMRGYSAVAVFTPFFGCFRINLKGCCSLLIGTNGIVGGVRPAAGGRKLWTAASVPFAFAFGDAVFAIWLYKGGINVFSLQIEQLGIYWLGDDFGNFYHFAITNEHHAAFKQFTWLGNDVGVGEEPCRWTLVLHAVERKMRLGNSPVSEAAQ